MKIFFAKREGYVLTANIPKNKKKMKEEVLSAIHCSALYEGMYGK